MVWALNRVSKKKTVYAFKMAAKYKMYDSGGKGLYVYIASGPKFQMTPKSQKLIHAWVSTAPFLKRV